MEVIIVPSLLILATVVTLMAVCFLRYCPERKRTRTTAPKRNHSSLHRHTQRHSHRHRLQGIDGEQACRSQCVRFSSYSGYIFHWNKIFQRTTHTFIYYSDLFSLSLSKAPPGLNPLEHEELPMSVQQVQQSVGPTLAAVPQMSTDRHPGAFSQVTALPLSFAINPNDTVKVYRARMDNRDVILRVLKGKVSCTKPTLKHRPTAYCMPVE